MQIAKTRKVLSLRGGGRQESAELWTSWVPVSPPGSRPTLLLHQLRKCHHLQFPAPRRWPHTSMDEPMIFQKLLP